MFQPQRIKSEGKSGSKDRVVTYHFGAVFKPCQPVRAHFMSMHTGEGGCESKKGHRTQSHQDINEDVEHSFPARCLDILWCFWPPRTDVRGWLLSGEC